MNILIKVPQECIDNGIKNDPNYCPIALAIRNVVGKDLSIDVSIDEIRIEDRTYPISFADFITSFDKGLNVEPFEFELDQDSYY